MSKQLAAAIASTAPSEDGFIHAQAGRSFARVLPKNAAVVCEQLAITRKPRKGGSKVAEKRAYPKFSPGMSTAQYVSQYHALNHALHLSDNWDAASINRAPCALYENGAFDFFPVEESCEESQELSQIAAIPESTEGAAPLADVPASSVESIGAMGKPQASEAFAAMMRAAREAKRIARRAIAQAIASSLRAVDEASRKASESAAQDGEIARMVAEFQDLEECPGHGGVGAAKNIRRVLKRKFPGVKFKVTSDYSSVNVGWVDGPVTGAVEDALAPFDIGRSDSQSDYFYTERTRFSEKFGGVQYLFTHRELSDSAVTASIHAIFGADGPTLAEWKHGAAWAQVECKGSYRDAQMWDQYGWLSMVRRHAEEK